MPEEASQFADISSLLKTSDVAKRLNISQRRVNQMVQMEQIAHIKFGRIVRFREEHVTAFLLKHAVEVFKQPEKKPKVDPLSMRLGRF